MLRLKATLFLCAATLTACGQAEQGPQTEASSYAAAPAEATVAVDQTRGFQFSAGTAELDKRTTQSGESYVYDHNLTVSMSSAFIKARFERARDKCQNDPALKCKITSASFRLIGEPDAPLPIANLSVALPHDSVAIFEQSLLELLPDEDKDDLVVKSRNTNAQNVTNQVRDIEARLAQLTNYRERMMELSKRGGSKTDDLIKIEGEISRTQSEIEQIEAQRRDLADRIAKENLSISFEPQSTVADAFQPVRDVWQNSLRTLGDSTAAVITLIVALIPWIPVGLLGFFAVRWLIRRVRRAS